MKRLRSINCDLVHDYQDGFKVYHCILMSNTKIDWYELREIRKGFSEVRGTYYALQDAKGLYTNMHPEVVEEKPSTYNRTVCGVGYNSNRDKYKSTSLGYDTWKTMLRRCYDKNSVMYKGYGEKGITVCDEWLDFSNFAEWYEKHYKEGGQVDKDILKAGNKVYCPEYCRVVPSVINNLLPRSNSREKSVPLGVSYNKNTGLYVASMSDGKGGTTAFGSHKTPEEAFKLYKDNKERRIKDVAEMYYKNGGITEDIYNALITYEVMPYSEDGNIQSS